MATPKKRAGRGLVGWWEEDADRLNKLASLAEDVGAVVGTTPVPPPLDRDGSLLTTKDDDFDPDEQEGE